MGHVYTDSQMMLASDIAYLDMRPGDNVGRYVDNFLNRYAKKDSSGNYVYDNDGNIMFRDGISCSEKLKSEMGVCSNIVQLDQNTGGLGNWRKLNIVDVCNDNKNSGYYGCLISSGDDNVILANRGSEGYDLQQFGTDWVNADFGMLDNAQTEQQKKAAAYIEKLWYKHGQEYDSFSLTGHSLGGTLADYQTINAPRAMYEKIDRCVNFDGPGLSDECIKANQAGIDSSNDVTISAHNDRHHIPGVSMFYRHDTRNVNFDDKGNVIQAEREDYLSRTFGPFSRVLEAPGRNPLENFITIHQILNMTNPNVL